MKVGEEGWQLGVKQLVRIEFSPYVVNSVLFPFQSIREPCLCLIWANPLKEQKASQYIVKIPGHVSQSLKVKKITWRLRPIMIIQKIFYKPGVLWRQMSAPNICKSVSNTPAPKFSAIRSIHSERQELVQISDLTSSTQTNPSCALIPKTPRKVSAKEAVLPALGDVYLDSPAQLCRYSNVVN